MTKALSIFYTLKNDTVIYSLKNFALLQYCIEKSIGKQKKIHPFLHPTRFI